MKLIELIQLLNATGLPVAFSHFEDLPNFPAPSPPFITYMTPGDSDFQADNVNYHEIVDVDIELHTDKKDLETERIIEAVLKEHELPYSTNMIYIETEHLFRKTYEVRLI